MQRSVRGCKTMRNIDSPIAHVVSPHFVTPLEILTIPCDGENRSQSAATRTDQTMPSDCHFKKTSEAYARTIAIGYARRLSELCGGASCVVIATSAADTSMPTAHRYAPVRRYTSS